MNQQIITSSLAPKVLTEEKDIKKISPYLNALKKVVDSKDINNVALTGAYGSGKSTIIRTFQARNDYKYLNISLATFKDEIDENEIENLSSKCKNDKIKNIDRLIELSILQQIFYHVKPNEIPDSRFERINSISNKQLKYISFGFIVWLISTLMLFKNDYFSKLNPDKWTFSISDLDLIAIISLIVFFSGVGFLTSKLIRVLNKAKISKLNFLKGELELGKNIDKSIFNEHLDEILYFFENTEYSVVIIEDLDRFKNTEVFTKLREINLLVNNSKQINRKIVFIYAIRDDIFKDEERTKFFDYIIPVIPFINPTNANEQLTKFIDEADLKHDFTDDFKDSVITFIDDIDMRLLTNIFHEYTIYKESLGSNDIIQDNLFAIIIYKNLYPKDFVELSRNKGILFNFFKNKKEYIKDFISKIDLDIEKLETRISNIEKEQVINLKELRAIYINAIQGKISDAIEISLNDNSYNFYELNDEDIFNDLLKEGNVAYYENQVYNNQLNWYKLVHSGVSFSEIEELVNNEFTFEERQAHILDRDAEVIEELKAEIERLNAEKIEVESWDVKKVFESVDIEPHLDGFSNSNLMRNLLINGYINENYNHYITLFHEINITKKDYDFERNVKSGIVSKFDFELTKVKNVIKKIPLKYFERKSILNYDLLAYLLNNNETNTDKYENLLKLLTSSKQGTKDSHDLFRFIRGYLFDYEIDESIHKGFTNKSIGKLINILAKKWDKFWLFIDSQSGLPKIDKDKFLRLIIKYADIEDIIKIGSKSKLKDFISKDKDFISLVDETEQQKAATVLQRLNVKFEKLTNPIDKTKKLFDFIYENNLYELNVDNVQQMANVYVEDLDKNNFLKSNYSVIINSKPSNLIKYINTSFNEYIKSVFLKIETNDSETEESLIEILNNKDLKSDLLIKVIDKQKKIIDNLSLVKLKYSKELLLEKNKVVAKWSNVYDYFSSLEDSELNDDLINFLNVENNYEQLSKAKLKDSINATEKDIESFIIKLIKCNELTYESYSNLIRSTHYTWNAIGFEVLDSDKVKWLIRNKKLNLTESNYDKLKENYPNSHITLIEVKQSNFLSKWDKLDLDLKDYLMLLKSKDLSNKNKIGLIQLLDENTIIANKELGKIACDILANSKYIPLSFDIIKSLFANSILMESKIKLFNLHFNNLTEVNIDTLIGLMSYPYNRIAEKRKKPTIKRTTANVIFVKNLLEIGYISSYKLTDNQIKIVARY